jgi:hypothetical protein
MKSISHVVLAVTLFASAAMAQGDSFGSKPAGTPQTSPAATPPSTPASAPAAAPQHTPRTPTGGAVGKGDERSPAAPAAPDAAAQPAPAPSLVTPLTPQPAGPMPTASEIFAKSIEAIGGADAVRKHTSMQTLGTLSMPAAGMNGKMEVITLAPNKVLTSMEFPGVGKMRQGFDGTVGWSMNPMQGPSLIEGKMLEEMKKSSDMYKDLDPGKLWTKAETKGAVNFAGVPCWEIAVDGAPGTGSVFYEIQSGLTRGMTLTVESAMGQVPTTTVMSDYKDFDGVKLATRTEVEAMGMKQTLTIDSVNYATVDPALFNLPPEIQALVDTKTNPMLKGGQPPPPKRTRGSAKSGAASGNGAASGGNGAPPATTPPASTPPAAPPAAPPSGTP